MLNFVNKKVIILLLGLTVLIILIFVTLSKPLSKEGFLFVKTVPTETVIIINNKEYKDQEKIELTEGKYKIIAKKDGYEEVSKENIVVKKGETSNIEITLKKALTKEEINFIRLLPHENERYGIFYERQENGILKLTIKLYVIINGHPGEELRINQQLSAYKKEALKWVTSQSIAPETLTIEYVPKEATNL